MGSVEKRKQKKEEVNQERKRALTEADITIMSVISPKAKDIEEYKV